MKTLLIRLEPYDSERYSHPHNLYPPIDLAYAIPVMYPTANGRLFMRGQDAIYCYDIRRGGPATGTEPPALRMGTPRPRALRTTAVFDIRGRRTTDTAPGPKAHGRGVRLARSGGGSALMLQW